MSAANIAEVTDATFAAEVEGHAGAVVVDVWAEWCGPCRAIAPILEQLAGEYEGRVKVAKVDADANPEVMRRFAVRGLPTLLLFRDGKVVDTLLGAHPRPTIAARFEALGAA